MVWPVKENQKETNELLPCYLVLAPSQQQTWQGLRPTFRINRYLMQSNRYVVHVRNILTFLVLIL